MAWLCATFQAEQPVCCPEHPLPAIGNIIRGGFVIPGSALIGALLWRLREEDRDAECCFRSPGFRVWPLQPCGWNHEAGTPPPDSLPVRVGITHRVANELGEEPDTADFFDESVPGDSAPHRSKVYKAVDGVLLMQSGNGRRMIWPSGMMPRVVTTHAVPDSPYSESGDELYSVESLAPQVWKGLIEIPLAFAEALRASLDERPWVSIGKRRSVQGGGQLALAPLLDDQVTTLLTQTRLGDSTVLIAQSPIALPGEGRDAFNEQLRRVASEWARRFELPDVESVWGAPDILFGWNRTQEKGRIPARRVARPGSVIRLAGVASRERLGEALRIGMGGDSPGPVILGRLAAHPGVAEDVLRMHQEAHIARPTLGGECIRAACQFSQRWPTYLPSPIARSQIQLLVRAIEHEARTGNPVWRAETAKWLDQQGARATDAGRVWREAREGLESIIAAADNNIEHALRGMRVLADLVASRRG